VTSDPSAVQAASAPGRRRRTTAWRRRLGLLRSLLIYYGVPFKIRRLAELYRPFVKRGDLCFDVGAHVGDRTLALRRLGARVVAVEPQPICVGWLRWRYGGDPGITIVDAGVAEAEGARTMFVSEQNPTVSSLSPAWVESVRTAPRFAGVRWDDEIPVPVTTLDTLITRFGSPALCKLDVEGSEAAALAGLSRAIPTVIFESIPAQRSATRACLTRLEALGSYEYNRTEREVPRLRHVEWMAAEAMAAIVDALPDSAHSGDIFARLRRAAGSG